jgi:zinc protease
VSCNKLRALTIAAALAVAPTAWLGDAVAVSGPDIAHFSLANGLEVVVIPDHRTPVVTHMVWYRVGSADETAGKSGLAHFLEHLMFKGTSKNPQGLFSQTVAVLGGQENAFTSSDYTGYFQRVAREQLRKMMEFESDRMTSLTLSEEEVKPELQVVLEEQNMRVANNPDARLEEQMEAALYLNHPYGRPVIGWRHELEQLTRADALEFYKRFYTPNNAILVVAGDVTAEEVKTLAEETYGKVPRITEIAPRMRPQEPKQEAARTVTLAEPRVTQPSVLHYYLVPSSTTAKPGESEALLVLAHILGGGQTNRLYESLVVDKGIAVSAGANYSSTALDQTRFAVYGAPTPGTTLTQIEEAIDAVIAEIVEKGVTEEELVVSKNRLIADAVYAQDNQGTLARWYGSVLTSGGTTEEIKNWPDRMRAVTVDNVRDAARTWFDKRRSVTGYLVGLNHAAILIGGTATRAEATGQAIQVIEDEFRAMAKDGPTQDELDKAKTFLKGSFALELDTSSKIANQLVMMQIDNLGIDYIDRRPAFIDAVTLADAKRVAKRLLDPGLLVTVVGRPQGVTSKGADD